MVCKALHNSPASFLPFSTSTFLLQPYQPPILLKYSKHIPITSTAFHKHSTRTLEWVAMPSFWGSSQPRDQTQVSCTAGRFFTTSATSVQFSSVAQSCPTLCDPTNRSTPGLPVHHQLPEFTQTHVHRVSYAIQPSHPLSSPSPPALNPSQHQSLFQ